jgi:superfamily II DNA helicase RecQ
MAINLFKTKIIPEDQIVYVYDLVKNIVAPGERAFVSPEIQKMVDSVLDKRFPKDWRNDQEFIDNIRAAFRKKNFSTYSGKYFPDYYAAYYLPNNLYKIQLMFLELFRLGKISFSEKKIRVLDIGTAVGTTAWALYDFYDILTNVLCLYGLQEEQLPVLEIDGVEKYQSNIDFFSLIINQMQDADKGSKVIINVPSKGDVLKGGLDKINLKKYDVVFASNIISEFPSLKKQTAFAEKVVDDLKKKASFVLIETAFLKDTRSLKKIQYALSKKSGIHVISPCGKINGFTNRCTDCHSYRRENLNVPETMKLFLHQVDDSDENEKLKWSYAIFSKQSITHQLKLNGYSDLNAIAGNGKEDTVSIEVEIVSGKIWSKKNKDHYYLRVCDQSEDEEQFLLKVPKYFELPRYHFGDVFEIENATIEPMEWNWPKSIRLAVFIDPRTTIVENKSELLEPKGLVGFKNIEESNINYFLKRFFGFKEFNEGQFDILKKVLGNEDVLGILATGGGKSLTYQLPALLKPGISIIVSPLKSLMDDQVNGIKNRFGFDFVDRIHSGMSIQEKEAVFQRFKNGRLKILYVAPERLMQKSFQQELLRLIEKGININYFPIDEAHCISEWGHDFRPAYARLKERQEALPHVDGSRPSIIALTATASQKVQEDVLEQLNMNEKDDLIHNIIDRKELSLEVLPMRLDVENNQYQIEYRDPENNNGFITHTFEPGTKRHDVLEYVLKEILPKRFDSFSLKKDAGLIFTIYADPKPAEDEEEFNSDKSREGEGARWISKHLNRRGIKSYPWFAAPGYRKGRTYEKKERIRKAWEKIKTKTQEKYIGNDLNLLVSTKGFGMGIDKPNIRYIIHYGFPGSLESYFQQIGRAGRDRTHSHCILLWDSPTDECRSYITDNEVPECFELKDDTGKYEYNECPYRRPVKCDYAKQIFFIETGYPTEEEFQAGIAYLKGRADDKGTLPWVYIKIDYIKDHVAGALNYEGMHRSQLKERLIIEKLYTMNYIADYAETYLKISIKRKSTMREIYNSTNSAIIQEHINYLEKIYPGFLDLAPGAGYTVFPIDDYVQELRKQDGILSDITIDEVVQFFNVLNERDDIQIRKNYGADYGYEIKLNLDMLNTAVAKSKRFKKVAAWKDSQYSMLKNVVKYAELQPFVEHAGTSEDAMCRRSHIMTVFSTVGAQVGKDVRCDYCDNCGYHNNWGTGALDITAGLAEQKFRDDIRAIYSKQSKDELFLKDNLDYFFGMVDKMIKEGRVKLVETISDSWLEQIGEKENAATNLMLAIVHGKDGELVKNGHYLNTVFNSIRSDIDLSQKIILNLQSHLSVDLKNIYYSHFHAVEIDKQLEALTIFSSDETDTFEEVETEIGLNLVETQLNKYDSMLTKFENMEA